MGKNYSFSIKKQKKRKKINLTFYFDMLELKRKPVRLCEINSNKWVEKWVNYSGKYDKIIFNGLFLGYVETCFYSF